jgi:hypothetical protein
LTADALGFAVTLLKIIDDMKNLDIHYFSGAGGDLLQIMIACSLLLSSDR